MHHDQRIYEEARLITLLSEDSEYAFQLMYDRHRNRIYQTAIRYLKSPVLAQEVVQDVFLKLWIERRNIRTNQPIEAWLYTVAKNNLINRLKKIAHEWKMLSNLKLITPQFENASTKIDEAQYNELLQKAILTLPPQQQSVFCLARQEHLTYIQIGEKMGISPLTVKKHMSRALLHIKTCFAGFEDLFFIGILLNITFFFSKTCTPQAKFDCISMTTCKPGCLFMEKKDRFNYLLLNKLLSYQQKIAWNNVRYF